MKRLMTSFLAFAFLLFAGCSRNDANNSIPSGLKSGIRPVVNPVGSGQPPVVFVHGLLGGPGFAFFNMFEKFESHGFPRGKMAVALLPRIGESPTGDEEYAIYVLNGGDYATYNGSWSIVASEKAHWKNAGNTAYNVQALHDRINELRASTGEDKVDLVGHSNGVAVIRELLAYANDETSEYYSLYGDLKGKIRKVVFIAGLDHVCEFSTICQNYQDLGLTAVPGNLSTYLSDVAPDSKLPEPCISENCPENSVQYYNLTSETQFNTDSILGLGQLLLQILELITGGDNCSTRIALKDTYDIEWQTNPGSNDWNSVDHETDIRHQYAIKKVFCWLTGLTGTQYDANTPGSKSQVNISGRIMVKGGCDNINPCTQFILTRPSGKPAPVEIKYYDTGTGAEISSAGSVSWNDSEGRYTINGVSTSQNLKVIVTNYNYPFTRDSVTYYPKTNYFLADKVTQDSYSLDFFAPLRIHNSDNLYGYYEKGKVSVRIASQYSFLSRNTYSVTPDFIKYYYRTGDSFTGEVSSYYYDLFHYWGAHGEILDSTCIPAHTYDQMSTVLRNFGSTTVDDYEVMDSCNEYNFVDPEEEGHSDNDYQYFTGMNVYVKSKLNDGPEVKAKIHGNDMYYNIIDYIVYLYPPLGLYPNY